MISDEGEITAIGLIFIRHLNPEPAALNQATIHLIPGDAIPLDFPWMQMMVFIVLLGAMVALVAWGVHLH